MIEIFSNLIFPSTHRPAIFRPHETNNPLPTIYNSTYGDTPASKRTACVARAPTRVLNKLSPADARRRLREQEGGLRKARELPDFLAAKSPLSLFPTIRRIIRARTQPRIFTSLPFRAEREVRGKCQVTRLRAIPAGVYAGGGRRGSLLNLKPRGWRMKKRRRKWSDLLRSCVCVRSRASRKANFGV